MSKNTATPKKTETVKTETTTSAPKSTTMEKKAEPKSFSSKIKSVFKRS